MNPIKTCIECAEELTLDKNWWPSFETKYHYKCISCFTKTRLKNHVKAGTAGPKMLARHLGHETLDNYNAVVEGYVYVISNPAWEGWFKVGMAVDAYDRCAQYQTSSPYRDYVVEYCKYFEDRRKAESSAHALLEGVEQRGEWFRAELSVIKNKIKTIEGA
tara:strand:- start:2126 stop:2608 length:483 start_codon:yes stop_codon:yes gene_type:complete